MGRGGARPTLGVRHALWGALFLALGLAALFAAGSTPQVLITETGATRIPGGVAVFARIEATAGPDRLIGVSSDSGTASLYSPEDPNGPPLPEGAAQLAADGAHIRITGLSDMAEGRLIPLTLTFATAGEVAAKARLAATTPKGGATEVGLFGLGDICVVGDGEPAPEIALSVTPEQDGWRVRVIAQDFTFSEARTGLIHVPGEGHGHLYVGGAKLGRLYEPSARIGALPPGRHVVRVTLNTNDHRAYVVDDAPVTATAEIVVD